MKRRNFIALGASALAVQGCKTASSGFFLKKKSPKIILPTRLKPGSLVAIVAPGSPTSVGGYEAAAKNLETLGYQVQWMPNAQARNGYLAGTDEQRLSDLHAAFADPKIEGIWCLRGGYGTTRLLSGLDFDLIRRNPKVFVGYSDITALHTAIHQQTGLVTFHGPVAKSDFPQSTVRDLKAILQDGALLYGIKSPSATDILRSEEYRPEIIQGGTAEGTLLGGNLSLLCSLVGTEFEPDFRGKIAFIEDVDEKPYRIDRMLTQLLASTNLKKAKGIALGVFANCRPAEGDMSLSLSEMFFDRLGNLGIPVAYGLPFGHIPEQATLPIGIRARLDTVGLRVTLLEQAVR